MGALMKIEWALVAILAFLTSGAGRTVDVALTGAKIYPSPTDPPIEDGSIVIRDGHILTLGPSSTVAIPRDADVIDCRGLVVTAGFWNSHVHILTPALLHASAAHAKELDEQLNAMFNRWGFTTVFDLSSVLDNTVALRARIDGGELRGPRILTVGEPVWTVEPVYARDFLEQNHIHIAKTIAAEEAVALVRDHAEHGADGIKLFAGSYQGQGKVAVLPLPTAKAAVAEAHRHGMPVFAHPQNVDGVNVAIESGVDVLAHTVPQSPPWTAAFISRLRSAHISLVPTLTLFEVEARTANSPAGEREEWIDRMVAELRAYSQAGGDVLFGTDIGYIEQYDTSQELALMARSGMNYQQILASLTTNPARKFHAFDHSGRIARGMDADLVILSADPAQDPTAFSKVRYAIRNGIVIYGDR